MNEGEMDGSGSAAKPSGRIWEELSKWQSGKAERPPDGGSQHFLKGRHIFIY